MLSYETWKVVHLAAGLLLFAALGGLVVARQRLQSMLHGVALLGLLVAGFAILAKLQIYAPGAWPAWVWIKLVAWLLLGASPVALKRAPDRAGWVLTAMVLLGAIAAWAAVAKPGG
ncbi:MAG TPA: hypothetical protein VJS92_06750 [Candidatus Polarisedimenticolaceae bacterium]|nr:hypothetical protein [Candidatus Polarisedimenticolaceae bacterium]